MFSEGVHFLKEYTFWRSILFKGVDTQSSYFLKMFTLPEYVFSQGLHSLKAYILLKLIFFQNLHFSKVKVCIFSRFYISLKVYSLKVYILSNFCIYTMKYRETCRLPIVDWPDRQTCSYLRESACFHQYASIWLCAMFFPSLSGFIVWFNI